jgi:hypothetical protein
MPLSLHLHCCDAEDLNVISVPMANTACIALHIPTSEALLPQGPQLWFG